MRQDCTAVAIYIFSLHWLILTYLSKKFLGLDIFLHCFLICNAYGQKLTDFSDVPAASVLRLKLVLKREVADSFESYANF